MEKVKILWADDEIDLLKPHILFLEEKGYTVTTANSGADALDYAAQQDFDIVFLDENMPGLSGLETLQKLKVKHPSWPVIMITKSEEEYIMEDAIGSKISDYLIKPVNPNQILLSLKKNLDNKRLVSEKTTSNYQQEFRNISMNLSDRLSWKEWEETYKKLIYWELELENSNDDNLIDILKTQKSEANSLFFKFIERNYVDWLNGKNADKPNFSHTLFKNNILKEIEGEEPVFLFLIDNLRLDQWKVLQPIITEFYKVEREETYCSILPTATQYARNAFFSGLLPLEMEKRFPQQWKNDEDEDGKNNFEDVFLGDQLKRLGKNIKFSYTKITNLNAGKKMVENLPNLLQNKFNAIVYNFVDMLSHARTEMEVIRELADTERAYRSITESWFEHSPLQEALKILSTKKVKIIITTDHGTVHVKEPSKIIGDKNTNSNLRYKTGKSLAFEKRDVFEVKNPHDAFLPKQHVSSCYVFAKEDKFFAYPNNYNHYVSYYRNTFQHGGISMEEMIIPYIVLHPKG
jgi:CheY-like chemotaxis protein